jgi:hypothetical protein
LKSVGRPFVYFRVAKPLQSGLGSTLGFNRRFGFREFLRRLREMANEI